MLRCCGVVALVCLVFGSVFDFAFLCVVGWLLACLCVGGAVVIC